MEAGSRGSVLFLTKYSRKGASTRYRTLQYLPHLERAGFHCDVSPLFDDDYLDVLYQRGAASGVSAAQSLLRRVLQLAKSWNYDLLVIEKELFPYLPGVAERLLSRLGVPYIIDYDDALFHQYDTHPSWLVRVLLGRKIARVMRSARLVTAGNRYLADYADKAGSRAVRIVPTVIDLERYPVRLADRPSSRAFTIGWIGSPSTVKYLDQAAPALASVCSGGKARVVLIGSGPCILPGVPCDVLPWSESTEASLLSGCDVGIMPLPDNPWERGKCGLKLVQYMACGLPVVASPVGINADIVEEDENGFLAPDTASWVRALNLLRDDPALCSRLGRAGREKVEERFSLQITVPILIEIISNVMKSSSANARRGM